MLDLTGRNVRTLMDVAFDHHAHNGILPSGDLLGKNTRYLGLVLVILLRIAVAAVDHQTRRQALCDELLLRLSNTSSIVVRPLFAAAKDHKAIRVAYGADNSNNTWLSDRQEVVRVLH